MRILHLCDSLNPAGLGGYESYLHYLTRVFALEGHSSVVVTQAPRRDAELRVQHEHYDLYQLPGNYLEARKWEFLSLPQDQREEMASVLFVPDDLERNVDALVYQLQEIISMVNPDVIHAHSTYIVFNQVLNKIRSSLNESNIPIIATIHGLPKSLILPSGESTTDYDQLVKCSPFDCVLAVSDVVEKTLKEHYAVTNTPQSIKRLYIGIDTDTFRPIQDVHKRWDLAFLGRFEHMKAVDLFPEMLQILRDRLPRLKMVMTGAGSLLASVRDELEERKVSHMVDYLGVVETSRVPEIINASRLFLYPSREEPFGLSIIEAMACNIPVITTNVFGPREIITNGQDGFMVEPGSAEGLATAVEMLLEDKELYNTISSRARETVQSRFDMKKQSFKLLDLYESLISKMKDRGG